MRCSAWSSLAISVCSALVFAGTVAGHVTATPPFVAAGGTGIVHLVVPNELDQPMTGFTVTVPDGFEVAHAHPADGWDESVERSTALWTGGALGSGSETTFSLRVETPSVPGPAELQAVQRYGDEGSVRWPVALTVTPATGGPSQNLALATVVGLIGLSLVAVVVGVLWRRRIRTLQTRRPQQGERATRRQ